MWQTWNLSKILDRRIFVSFSKKKKQKKSENGEIYTAGSDGMDKFHLCHVVDVGPKQKPYFEICKGLNENQMAFFEECPPWYL